MNSNVSAEYSETITLLRKELKEKDANLHLAASYGNKLLQDMDVLSSKLLQTEIRAESLEQEKHSLQLKLETLEQTMKSQNYESEMFLEKNENLQKKISALEKENKIQQQKYDNISREKSDLETTEEELKLENSSLKNKIKLLEQQIVSLKEKATYSLNETKDEEDIPDVNMYISKNKTLEDAIAQAQYELEESKLRECRLSNLVKELEEAVSDRDKELSAYSAEIQKAKDFSAELQCEIEVLKLEQVDVNRRGNSMFGELDDRRKLVEKEYKALSQKYNNVLKNYEANKSELSRCKGHMAILLSMTSKKYQDIYIEKLESMLSSYKRNVENLTSRLEKATKNMQQQASKQEPSATDKYNYLRVMNQQAQKKIKDLENELISARLQINNVENNLLESHKNLYKAINEINELKIENLKLKHEIKELNVQPDSFVSSKSKPNIEILPGFESNSKSEKSAETMAKNTPEIKENTPNTIQGSDKESILEKDLHKVRSNRVNSSLREINSKSEQDCHPPGLRSENESVPISTKKNANCAQQ